MLVTPIRLERNISKTAGFRDSVPKDHQYEMAYGLSNGHVIDDVTWPQRCCEAVRSAILATAWLLVNWYSWYETQTILLVVEDVRAGAHDMEELSPSLLQLVAILFASFLLPHDAVCILHGLCCRKMSVRRLSRSGIVPRRRTIPSIVCPTPDSFCFSQY